jgi:hypothetical protein
VNIIESIRGAILLLVLSVAYWYWGDLAETLVLQDFELHSLYKLLAVLGGFGVQTCLDILILVNILSRLPVFILAFQDICRPDRSAPALVGAVPAPAINVRPKLLGVDLHLQQLLSAVPECPGDGRHSAWLPTIALSHAVRMH